MAGFVGKFSHRPRITAQTLIYDPFRKVRRNGRLFRQHGVTDSETEWATLSDLIKGRNTGYEVTSDFFELEGQLSAIIEVSRILRKRFAQISFFWSYVDISQRTKDLLGNIISSKANLCKSNAYLVLEFVGIGQYVDPGYIIDMYGLVEPPPTAAESNCTVKTCFFEKDYNGNWKLCMQSLK